MIEFFLPLLLLALGELVLAACALRVAVWAWRGFRSLDEDAPGTDPDGPGGRPIPITRARRRDSAAPLRAAA